MCSVSKDLGGSWNGEAVSEDDSKIVQLRENVHHDGLGSQSWWGHLLDVG